MSRAPRPSLRQVNWVLAALAVLVLLVTLSLLAWLRYQALSDLERDLGDMARSFDPERLRHGPGGNTLVRFELAEQLARQGERSPYIREAVVSLTLHGAERFIVPFTFEADHRGAIPAALAGFERRALTGPRGQAGWLYLRVDRTVVDRISWAIGATAVAIALMLAMLLARVWTQESSIVRTVIELNERRRELIRLERLALAGELSAGLLHDLRKPVLNIRHSLDELEAALGDFGPAAAPLVDLRNHTRLFFELLESSQIERFVRSDRVSEEYIDLGPILEYSFNLVRYEQRGVQIERHVADDLPPLFGHPFRLIQLFSNLILNAYQALGGHGTVRVDAIPERGGALVRLTDNGPGMSPEVAGRIFEPFFTTKAEGEGTGLGLSICRMIVEDLGGTLTVESRPGGPTAFLIWLPGEAPASVGGPRA